MSQGESGALLPMADEKLKTLLLSMPLLAAET
jgi:hypothetical protein